jgi:hypothetical protein
MRVAIQRCWHRQAGFAVDEKSRGKQASFATGLIQLWPTELVDRFWIDHFWVDRF